MRVFANGVGLGVGVIALLLAACGSDGGGSKSPQGVAGMIAGAHDAAGGRMSGVKSGADNGPPSRIRRLTPPSSFDVFAEEANTNGLALLEPGNALSAFRNDEVLLGCAHDVRSLAIVELSSARTPLALTFEGKPLNSPNDLTVRSDGTVYFTDPDWQLGPRTAEIGFTGVFRVALGLRDEVELVSDTLDEPNGVALSPDERTLYVGSSGADVFAYPLAADGSTGTPSVFASPGATDGMGIDCAGNLYVASGMQVHVLAPDGHELYAIDVAQTPSNMAFGDLGRPEPG